MVTLCLGDSAKKVVTLLKSAALLLLCVSLSPLQAATMLQATVDKNPLMLGEELLLQIELDEKVSGNQLDFSVLANDFNFSAPAISQSMQIINGRSSQSTRWQLSLFAKKTGTFVIPAFEIDGLRSEPITITVLPADPKGTGSDELFIQSSLTSSELYVQQLAYYEVKIYFNGDLQRGSLSQPELPGATIEQLGKDVEGSELVNGQRYQTITRRYTVIAEQHGDFELAAPWFKGEMIDRQSSRYDYFAKTKTVSAQGQALKLTVKPIPDNFKGQWLVSELVALTEEWTPPGQDLTQGEPVTRTITLTALDLSDHQLPDLNFSLPDGIKSYAEQPQSKKAERNGRLVAQKVFTSAVIATKSGELVLPAIRIPWWNSKTNELSYAELPERTLKAAPNPAQPEVQAAAEAAPASGIPPVIAAQPVSPWHWSYSSTVLLLLWLTTLVLWLAPRFIQAVLQKNTAKAKVQPQASVLKFSSRKLKAACLANNSTDATAQLLQWAQQGIDPQITRLSQLLTQLPECELRREIEKLCHQPYQALGQTWQGQPLFEAFAKYKHLQQLPVTEPLKPLYPA